VGTLRHNRRQILHGKVRDERSPHMIRSWINFLSLVSMLTGQALPLDAATAPAADIPIEIQARADSDQAPPTPATVHLKTAVGKSGSERHRRVTVPGSFRFPIPAGEETFRLTLESEHYWTPDQLIAPADLGNPLTLPLHRVGSISGTLKIPDDESPPTEILLRFQPTVSPVCKACRTPSEVRGEVTCPVEAKAWRCRLPVGALDLRLAAPGFIPHYRGDTLVTVEEELFLGEFALAVGASVVGQVQGPDGRPVVAAKVIVTPDLGDLPPTPDGAPLRLARQTTLTDTRGFFQVVGSSAGSHLIGAQHEGIHSQWIRATLEARQEFEMPEPLILAPPLAVTFRLSPSKDPTQAPWAIRLQARHPPVSRSGRVNDAGEWTARDLEPAEYILMVLDSRGARFHFENLVIDRHTGSQEIQLAVIAVEGEITLGEAPLPARIYFGGRSGRISIAMAADEEGQFSGLLPHAGEWAVDVAAEEPALYRRLAGVKVPDSEGGAPARVVIELPDTTLSGEVVDAEGHPVADATVLIAPVVQQEKLSPIRTQEDGSFESRGFAPGRFRLEAHDLSGDPTRSSAPVEIDIQKDLDPPPVRLVLLAGIRIEGRVQTPAGEGVAGAGIVALPLQSTGPGATLIPQAQSGPDGRFSLDLPSGTQTVDLTVMAAGFLFHRQQLAVASGKPILLQLVQDGGGELLFEDLPPSQIGQVYLLRHGRRWDLGTLLRWAQINGVPAQQNGLLIPRMPPGAYALCSNSDHKCTEDWLPDHGSLTLTRKPSVEVETNEREE
jgi:hypothetical protein